MKKLPISELCDAQLQKITLQYKVGMPDETLDAKVECVVESVMLAAARFFHLFLHTK